MRRYFSFYTSLSTKIIQMVANLNVEGSTNYKLCMNWILLSTQTIAGMLVYLRHRECWNRRLFCIWKKMILRTHSSTDSQVINIYVLGSKQTERKRKRKRNIFLFRFRFCSVCVGLYAYTFVFLPIIVNTSKFCITEKNEIWLQETDGFKI